MGPDERSGKRDLAGCCVPFGDFSVTAALGITAAGEIWAATMLWVTGSERAMTAKAGAPVLQPASTMIATRKKYNLKARSQIRDSSRRNGHTGSTCASRIQPHLDQHGRRSN